MAHPKRKTSKQRKNKRRTHYKAVMPAIAKCSNCGEAVRPHNICAKCGHYNGKQVIEIED